MLFLMVMSVPPTSKPSVLNGKAVELDVASMMVSSMVMLLPLMEKFQAIGFRDLRCRRYPGARLSTYAQQSSYLPIRSPDRADSPF